jgi:Holliday junction resolvasome RuvABC endonuclease subunit
VKIMGLDLSVTATGVCFPDGSAITVKPKSKGDDRLNEIRDHLRLAIRTCRADLVAVEAIQGRSLKGDAALVIPMLHGVVRAMLKDDGVPYVLVNQRTLKKYATGNGNASKTDMAMAAYKRARLEFPDDNQCDAWWLYAAAMERAEQLLFVLPLAQRQALDVGDWAPVAAARALRASRERAVQTVLTLPHSDAVLNNDPFA